MTALNAESGRCWVHTGIVAPYRLNITGLNAVEHDRGIAYSAKLVHPEHGIVGLISNKGCGDDTRFDAYDKAVFGADDLEKFLRQCRQDGEPMGAGRLPDLLDDIIEEAETAEHVAEARRAGLFLVRRYAPSTASRLSHRGSPIRYQRIVLNRAAREILAGHLDTGLAHDVYGPDAYWQMFNGLEWSSLLGPGPLTPKRKAARISRATRFIVSSLHCEPFDEQFRIYGNPAERFALIGDTTPTLNVNSWCRCTRTRPRTVRFERWNNLTLEESGVIHAAKNCRRLVCID